MGRSSLQGTPWHIDPTLHVYAPHFKQDEKICHYWVRGICTYNKATCFKKQCSGYINCPEFTSEDRFEQLAKKKKKFVHTDTRTSARNKTSTVKIKKKQAVNKVKKKTDQVKENTLGSDPRFKDIFKSAT